LRNVLIDTELADNERVLQHWHLPEDTIKEMSLTLLEGKDQSVKAKIDDVSLFCLKNIYVFAIRVSPFCLSNKKLPNEDFLWQSNEDNWWCGLLHGNKNHQNIAQQMQIQTWLRFTKLARILYQSFPEQVFENKIANLKFQYGETVRQFKAGHEFSPIVEYLLSLFFNNVSMNKIHKHLEQTQTDRMYVNVAYGLASISPEIKIAKKRYEKLFSLALYIDEKNDGYNAMGGHAYDPEFLNNLMKQDAIYRWKGIGTYSGYTIYSNVHFGSSGFFSSVIAPSHVPYIYGHMLVVGLFYQASLRYFAKEVSDATKELASENTDHQQAQKRFRELRKKFIIFTNDYWFRDVTDQIQGIEIFEKQTKSLRLNEEYILIKDEMERADEYMETLRKESFDQKTKLISGIAAVLGVAAVWASTLAAPTETFPSIFEFNRFNVAFAFSLCCSVVAIYLSFRKK